MPTEAEAATAALLARVRACTLCAAHLPLGPRPLLQLHPEARVLVAGQAPGRRAHASGVPFDDASGVRLRDWLGLAPVDFYDPRQLAILPLGLCYPGTGHSGDLPPRRECAPTWRSALLEQLPRLRLTVLVGRHAQLYHLAEPRASLTATVQAWRSFGPEVLPLPHPSPRNTGWLQRHPWFAAELLPELRRRVAAALAAD